MDKIALQETNFEYRKAWGDLGGVDAFIELPVLDDAGGGLGFGLGREKFPAALAGMIVERNFSASFDLASLRPFFVFSDRWRA